MTLLLSSCSSFQKSLKIETKPVEIPQQVFEKPVGVIAPEIKWIVIPYNNKAVFALDEKNYLSLATWLQDVLRYIKNQKSVIEAYEQIKAQ